MQKKTLALLVAGALTSVSAFAEDAPSPLTFNVGVVSDYLFRGVSQTHGDPALQGGVDYAFSNGFYVGAWGSTITWVKDWLGKGRTEIDVYGGYKGSFAGDWTYDVGYITYNYPGKGAGNANLANPNTQEVYAAIGYKWLTAKYSHATSKHFIGWYGGPNLDQNTKGSNYLELNGAYDLGDGWGISGHVGKQKVKGSVLSATGIENANYTDWSVGVTKDVGFGVIGLSYSDTDAKGTCPGGATAGTSSYCWGDNGTQTAAPSNGFRDVAKGTAVLSFKKTF